MTLRLLLTALFILVAVPTSSASRCFGGCRPPKSKRIQDVPQLLALNPLDPSSNTRSITKPNHQSDVLSSPRSSYSDSSSLSSVSSVSSDSSSSQIHPHVSYLHHQPKAYNSPKDIVFSLYEHLGMILKQIIGDIASIQIHLYSFKASSSVKEKMAAYRKSLKSIRKSILNMHRDDILPNNSIALLTQLSHKKKKMMQIYELLKIPEQISTFKFKFLLADKLFKVLLNQIPQICLVTIEGMDQIHQKTGPNGFMPLEWMKENGQDIIDYFGSNKRIGKIKELKLEMNTFAQRQLL